MGDATGTTLIPRTEIEDVLTGSVDLYHADLNADSREDYISVTWSGGVGVASETYFVYTILSTAHGHALWEVVTMAFEPRDFVEMRCDGPVDGGTEGAVMARKLFARVSGWALR